MLCRRASGSETDRSQGSCTAYSGRAQPSGRLTQQPPLGSFITTCGFSFPLPSPPLPSLRNLRTHVFTPTRHPTTPPIRYPLLLEVQHSLPLPQVQAGGRWTRQCKVTPDEARGRFTSQHAHVVQGGVHAARRAERGARNKKNVEPSRCPGSVIRTHFGQSVPGPALAVRQSPFLIETLHTRIACPARLRTCPRFCREAASFAVLDGVERGLSLHTHRPRTEHSYSRESAFAHAPHLVHPKIQDQGQCGGVPRPGVYTAALAPASWPK